jgi:hypothetical protein
MFRKANRDRLSADVFPPTRASGLLCTSALRQSLRLVLKGDQHMELDTAVSQGADAGATPVGSYNLTESGIAEMTALSTKSGNVPGQSPLSPMAT